MCAWAQSGKVVWPLVYHAQIRRVTCIKLLVVIQPSIKSTAEGCGWLRRAGGAEARAAEDPNGTGVLACSLAPSADAVAVLLDATLAALSLCTCASPARPPTHPSPADAAAPAAHAPAAAYPGQALACGAHADPGSGADPVPSPGAGGAWAAAAAAARCEAVWACAGGGGTANRLARAERLHAAARMAWLERVREDAGELPLKNYAHVLNVLMYASKPLPPALTSSFQAHQKWLWC